MGFVLGDFCTLGVFGVDVCIRMFVFFWCVCGCVRLGSCVWVFLWLCVYIGVVCVYSSFLCRVFVDCVAV